MRIFRKNTAEVKNPRFTIEFQKNYNLEE